VTLLRQGQMIANRYRIRSLIGEGGMGSVWLAEDLSSGKLVVVKQPRITGKPDIDGINIGKLRVEGEILQLLSHKNVVKLLDFVNIGAMPILVLEFVQGEVLERIAAGHPLEEKLAVEYTLQLLDALQYIHSLNIIHRDIRPKNMMAQNTRSHHLKLIDFGTAKLFYRQLDIPEAIISPGGYSPPEHYKLGYSPQGDIWGAGATLFYLLTGQHPLIVMGHYPHQPQPADPRRIRPDVSDRIAEVVIRATMPAPHQRFSTALEMKQALVGERPSAYRLRPRIIVRNHEIPITSGRVILGRDDRFDFLFGGETAENPMMRMELLEEKPTVEEKTDKLLIKLVDPGCYISRMHAEIFEESGRWYLKDLGSLNRTAILTDKGWIIIHRGHRLESQPYPLKGKDIISLAYDPKKGPYLVITFLLSQENIPIHSPG